MAVLLAAYLPGCMGWRDRATFAPTPASDRPAFLRITLQNGHQVELHKARIVGDSVIGQLYEGTARARGAVALQDVARIGDRHFKAGASALAILGTVSAVGMVSALIAFKNSFGSNWFGGNWWGN